MCSVEQRATKSERIEARATVEEKESIERAAALSNRSVSDFVISSAQKAAQEIIREQEQMNLTRRDSEAFVKALLNPSKPNAALREAAKHYKKVMGM